MERYCIHCGEEVSQEHKVCIHCGKPLPDWKEPEEKPVDETVDGADEEQSVEVDEQDDKTDEEIDIEDTDETAVTDDELVDQDDTTAEEKQAMGVATSKVDEETSDTSTRTKTKKKSNRWIKRIIWIIVALLIIFIIWAKNYSSMSSVEKRFQKALQNEDTKALTKLMVHNDASAIKTFEADAFIDLYNKRGQSVVNELTMAVESGKFLFLFDTYKIEANDQIPYDEAVDGLTYTFNGKELDVYDQDEEDIAFGPIAPGIYEVEAIIDSDFGEFTTTEEVTLDNPSYQEYTDMGLDFAFDHVVFNVTNFQDFESSDGEVVIKIDDKAFELNEDGETEKIGPLNINGDLEAIVETKLPWGNFASEKLPIDSTYYDVQAVFYNDDVLEDIRQTIGAAGEQFVEAQAKKSEKPLKLFGDQPTDLIASEFDNYDAYSGKLIEYAIDEETLRKANDNWYTIDIPNDVKADMPSIVLSIQYVTEEDMHDKGEDPDLYEQYYNWEIGLTYDKDRDNNWYIEVLRPHSWFDLFSATDTWDGADELYDANSKKSKKSKKKSDKDDDKDEDKDLEKEMEAFMKDYTDKSVEAINERDFSLVEKYISSDGPRYDEARDYIDYLESEGVYETWLGSELEEMKELGDDEWEVSMIEEFEIIWPDETKTEKFRTKLIVKRVDGDFLVHELTETNSI